MPKSKKSQVPDKNLFKGFDTGKNETPVQRVMPVKTDSADKDKLKPVHLLVTEEQKHRYDIYRANAQMKQRDFIVAAIEEYMEKHPLT